MARGYRDVSVFGHYQPELKISGVEYETSLGI